MEKDAKIYVAGHTGMVGSAIVRRLKKAGYTNIIGRPHCELDLTRQAEVEEFFGEEKPDYVFLAAAKVGGIGANIAQPAEFLMVNLQIQCNILSAAFKYRVRKLLFLGSSCIYPCRAEQPIREEALLTGPLEPTNEGYAIAKISGLRQCEYYRRQHGADFISIMPCNLYGYYDNFDINKSHIVPAMIRKFHSAKIHGLESVTIWGTGNAYRELLFTEDMADACLFVMDNYSGENFLNVGYGRDFTVMQIAEMVKGIVGYEGKILTDPTKPEGMFRKVVDSSRINSIGWKPSTGIEEGLRLTYQWFLENVKDRDSARSFAEAEFA